MSLKPTELSAQFGHLPLECVGCIVIGSSETICHPPQLSEIIVHCLKGERERGREREMEGRREEEREREGGRGRGGRRKKRRWGERETGWGEEKGRWKEGVREEGKADGGVVELNQNNFQYSSTYYGIHSRGIQSQSQNLYLADYSHTTLQQSFLRL